MTKRVFDEKTKRRLSGLLPFSPNSYVVWTPEEFFDFPVDLQPKFYVRPFDKASIDFIRDEAQKGSLNVESARKVITYALTNWRDLVDLGTELEISFSVESIGSLPESLVWIIYRKASEMTFGLSAEEKEGFGLQPVAESAPLSKAAESADSTPA